MFKKIMRYIVDTVREEYKFLIVLITITIILNIPLNYYITTGGGISNADKRISVENKNDSKGSFNISYVVQLDGTILTYGLSYLFPSWERESADDYKYDTEESTDDIEFRSILNLKAANSNATYWAYKLANKKIKETDYHSYVIALFEDEYDTPLEVQDEILSIDNKKYKNSREYREYIQTKNAGDILEVKVKRKNKEKIINAEVHEGDDGSKYMGVILQSIVDYETDPKLNIKFKSRESGPSGGLITTLEIYNQLTKKDLTGGKTIAGTGTIEEDGTIGEIGGIEYKVLGAAHSKADIFLAPAGDNYKDAKKYIADKKIDIELIEVKSIQDAIEKLEKLK